METSPSRLISERSNPRPAHASGNYGLFLTRMQSRSCCVIVQSHRHNAFCLEPTSGNLVGMPALDLLEVSAAPTMYGTSKPMIDCARQ